MSKKTNPRSVGRIRRKIRIRKRLSGTADRPRLSVFRSSRHMYAQLVDDDSGNTLAATSTQAVKTSGHGGNKDSAASVGTAIADAAKAAGISSVVFDRNGFKYHGRVKALAEAAREGGLVF
jgi:large subunit ribosomal protein L18